MPSKKKSLLPRIIIAAVALVIILLLFGMWYIALDRETDIGDIASFVTSSDKQAAQKRIAGVFYPETFKLNNGLQVVVISNHRAPVVKVTIWYKVGSADDPIGKSGLAHFLEHMMFKGTPDIPAGQYEKAISKVGGEHNAFTSRDYTGYYAAVAKEHLEMLLELEAGRMRGLSLLPEKFETERNVILEERRLRTDNNPRALLAEATFTAFYWHHPYGRPSIGWEHEIRALKHEDALEHYKKWYTPNNAVITIAGDVTLAEARRLIEKYFSKLEKVSTPQRHQVTEPPHRKVNQRVNLTSPLVDIATWSLDFPAPSYNSKQGSEHAYALQVLAFILSNGPNSRLHKALVEKQKIAASVYAGYNAMMLGPSSFGFSAQPTPNHSIEDIESGVRSVIEEVFTKPITQEEVDRAKQRMVIGIEFVSDESFAGSNEIGTALCINRTIEDVEDWPNRIQAITAEQVNQAAKYVLKSSSFVISILQPTPKPKKVS